MLAFSWKLFYSFYNIPMISRKVVLVLVLPAKPKPSGECLPNHPDLGLMIIQLMIAFFSPVYLSITTETTSRVVLL